MTYLTEISEQDLLSPTSYGYEISRHQYQDIAESVEAYALGGNYTFEIPELDTSSLVVMKPNFNYVRNFGKFPFITVFQDQLFNWIQTESFNYKLEEKVNSKSIEDSLDFVYDTLDDLMIKGNYSICNRILESLDVGKWPNDILIGVLTITLAWKNNLTSRTSFYTLVKEKLMKTYHEQEALKILDGLS